MNYNLLENIRDCMAVLCGQTLLYRGVFIANSLENFVFNDGFTKTAKLFHLKPIVIYDVFANVCSMWTYNCLII